MTSFQLILSYKIKLHIVKIFLLNRIFAVSCSVVTVGWM